MGVTLGITITQNSQSIEDNKSNVTVSVYCSWTNGSYNTQQIVIGKPSASGWLKIDGEQYDFRSTFNDNRTTTGSKTLFSKTLDVAHDAEGKKTIYCSAYFATGVSSGNITASDTQALTTIPRFATIKYAPNFNDEENPTITYSNPAGDSVASLRACISLNGTADDVAYRDISKTGTSYTFNLTDAERNVLRAATTDGNSRTVKFYVRTEIGGSYEGSNLARTFTIKNPNPTINPTIKDTNSTTVALTGDSSKLVRYYSNAAITIGAAAVKQATLKSQKVTCGSKSLTANGTINAIESKSFVFTATDSRGNTTEETVTPSFIEYIKLTCSLGNNMPDGEGNMAVKVSGNYFNGSFGSKNNSLSVYYRYKTSGGSYGSWQAMTVTKGDNTYSASANVAGLDYQTAYVFQAYAKDELSGNVYSLEKTVKATPIFDWGENDFNFNVPVFDEVGALIGNGLAAYAGGGANGIDPDTTLEGLCLTSHTNAPQGLGTFYYIFTAFYNTKSESAARAQVAFPYNKSGSLYHRYYASGEWSTWTRYMTPNEMFPVGSIVERYDNTSPADLYGGTWVRIEGRILYGCATSGTVGATGTHTTGSGSSSLPYVNVAIWRRTA